MGEVHLEGRVVDCPCWTNCLSILDTGPSYSQIKSAYINPPWGSGLTRRPSHDMGVVEATADRLGTWSHVRLHRPTGRGAHTDQITKKRLPRLCPAAPNQIFVTNFLTHCHNAQRIRS